VVDVENVGVKPRVHAFAGTCGIKKGLGKENREQGET
jgi:hypothetical protein